MKIGEVVGTVVSTVHDSALDGRRLLICDLLDLDGEPEGDYLLAVDAVGAGAGEVVLILDEGSGARQILERDPAPIRAVVVGVIDDVELTQ
ncbi:MAG: EutN/CcmL family microcompartment protein [Acidimicrobiia bacterium]